MIAVHTRQLAAQIGPIEAAIIENSGIGSIGPGANNGFSGDIAHAELVKEDLALVVGGSSPS